LDLYARKGKSTESLQELYLEIGHLISFACPNDVSETSERLAINQFTAALNNENMRIEVLNKNPVSLETVLHIAMPYEALEPEHSAPLEAHASPISPKGIDVSAFIYDDKDRKKDSLRTHEIHVVPDSDTAVRYEAEHTLADDGQQKIMNLL